MLQIQIEIKATDAMIVLPEYSYLKAKVKVKRAKGKSKHISKITNS